MIYTSAIYANPEHTQVTGTDANGNTETVSHDHTLFRQPDDGPVGFLANGGVIADYVAPPVVTPAQPTLFAAVAVCIEDGAISMIEQAAQLQGAVYEDGWLMVWFATPLNTADYLVFAQSDIPAKIEQFKDTIGFELVFSDATGDPLNPGRIDIQILKVR